MDIVSLIQQLDCSEREAKTFEALLEERDADIVRIDSELVDDSGEIGALLVLVAHAEK